MKKNNGTTSKCPAAIQTLFDAANSYEFGSDLPPVDRTQRDEMLERYKSGSISDARFNDAYRSAEDGDFSVWLNSLKYDPRVKSYEILKTFLLKFPTPTLDPDFASKSGSVETFHKLRGFLANVVEHAEYDRDQLERSSDPSFETWRYLQGVALRMLIAPSKIGREIRLSLHPLYEPVIGCDLRRFRQCPVCKKFLWADRLEREGCSEHNDLVRKWRKKLNDAADRYAVVDSKLDVERAKQRPNPALIKKYEAEIVKLGKVIDKYSVARKRVWYPKP